MASVVRIDQHAAVRTARRPKADPPRMASRGASLDEFRRRADADYARSLTRLIESEIIPRLLVAHGTPASSAIARSCHGEMDQTYGTGMISAAEIAAFAPLALQVEADELLAYVDCLIDRGVSHETLLVDLLAPAARLLGTLWEEDRCDFVDVTMGLWRLQEVVHEVSERLPRAYLQAHGGARHAMFASLEGDQHSFGTVMIEELFAANGWVTERLTDATTQDLLDRVGGEWFDLAGLTISCDCHIAPLPSIVRALRASSRNSRICVMVGGRVFAGNTALAAAVGADGTAPDARVALRVAGELVDAVARDAVSPMSD